jgi:hypothetical protein
MGIRDLYAGEGIDPGPFPRGAILLLFATVFFAADLFAGFFAADLFAGFFAADLFAGFFAADLFAGFFAADAFFAPVFLLPLVIGCSSS